MRGYTEVAGQSARVIVANPYGISCNGCGFINTPRVTLGTGKPVLDNGRLERFQVDGGVGSSRAPGSMPATLATSRSSPAAPNQRRDSGQ
nr:filamentous hemagglutinin N-terminal domain-containing protein [Pseudomonas sp. TH49]